MTIYTAISFAPVQGFIEKSRKLRDLYGASQILSYLSFKLIRAAIDKNTDLQLIQPNIELVIQSTINVQRGIPNRILFKGDVSRDVAKIILRDSWNDILQACRTWIEANIHPNPHWHTEWDVRWKEYAWELFWGQGEDPEKANQDLDTRKLKRDWIAINWTGESSSLTGADAIAWHRLGDPSIKPDRPLSYAERKQQEEFYLLLSRRTENCPQDKQPEGKFIAPNERLSIPELVKRLVTLENEKPISNLNMPRLGSGFQEIQRKPKQANNKTTPGQWTGWFMGDGDKVGNYLKEVYKNLGDTGLQEVSQKLLRWGESFQSDFPNSRQPAGNEHFGRIVYAGGDDFLGLIYSLDPYHPIPAHSAFEWLLSFPDRWSQNELPKIANYPKPGNQQSPTVSMGFVWAGHSVPQRDVLQHCREAEKRSKALDRNRVTMRVVFNSGQFVQWTCPWDKLNILNQYVDRNDQGGRQANWSHIYNDWQQLKSRHAIRLTETEKQKVDNRDRKLAIQFLNLYFNNAGLQIDEDPNPEHRWKYVVGDDRPLAIVKWIDDLVKVGWQLCSDI
jgi:CRISPR-associated protein Cmr2